MAASNLTAHHGICLTKTQKRKYSHQIALNHLYVMNICESMPFSLY